MPAQSFDPRFINALLSCEKQQTTRKPSPRHKPPRIKINDTVQVYVDQRKPIRSKPLLELTGLGRLVMCRLSQIGKKNYPAPDSCMYYAHYLGKIVVSDIFEIVPSSMSGEALEAWAWADNFKDFDAADAWFTDRYDAAWVDRVWTVQQWHGWIEQYFHAPGLERIDSLHEAD